MPYIYVSNNTPQTYLLFAENATGDTAPISTISGGCSYCSGIATSPDGTHFYEAIGNSTTVYEANSGAEFTSTAIEALGAIAVDAAGNVYIADPATPAILKFPAGSSGTVSPSLEITGSNTGLGPITGLAVDLNGTIYATNEGGAGVLEFPVGSNGNAEPNILSGSNTGIVQAFGVAVNLNGQIAVSTDGDGLVIFSPGSQGNVSPVAHFSTNLSGTDEGVCYDPATNDIFVVKSDGSLAGFDQNGNQTTYLTGSTTTFNHPKNCGVSSYNFANTSMMSRGRR